MNQDRSIHADRAPRVRKRLRNDTRGLLRSRTLQAALATVAAVQVVAVAAGKAAHDNQPRHFRDLVTAMAPDRNAGAPVLTPITVAPLKTLEKLASAAPKGDAGAKTSAAAEELASKYRQRGYKVSSSLAMAIHDAAEKNQIDPELAFGLVRTESGFKTSATSPVGAVGLTQLMPATARWFQRGVTRSDLRNPDVNLNIGFRYLRELIDKYDGDTDLALTAYNRGPGIVDRVLKRGGNPDNGYAAMVKGRKTASR